MQKAILNGLFGLALVLSVLITKAAEPANNPTNFTSSNVKSWGFAIRYNTPSTSFTGFLILRSEQPVTVTPVDGTTYQKGDRIGAAKVLYVGSGNSVWVREVLMNSTHHFAIFAYSGSGTSIDYKQTAPLTGSVTAAGSNEGTYFNGINPGSTSFISDLTAKIYPHTQVNYSNGMYDLCDTFYIHDTIGGKEYVRCQYSDETVVYTPPLSIGGINYNREHTLPKSWMRTYAAKGAAITNDIEGSDYHMLFLTNGTVNTQRFNYAYGIVKNATYSYINFKQGTNAAGIQVAEPQNSSKGDAARAMMYTMICYNGLSGNWALQSLLSNGPEQADSILKLWNAQDPPSLEEKTRHEYVASRQKNRNPFIDHPEWANCINFYTLAKKACVSGIDQPGTIDFSVYPVPAADELHIATTEIVEVHVIDALGRWWPVETREADGAGYVLITGNLPSGSYVVVVANEHFQATRQIAVVH